MKKMLSGLLCFAMLFSMAACTSTTGTNDTSESQSGEAEISQTEQNGDTITVTDMKGTVEIPANPQRIVDTSGSADELIILEMPFVGSANTSMFDSTTVPEYLQEYFAENNVETVGNYSGSAGDLDLEKIAELEPDLIIMNIRHDNVYDQMCEIAPTVMLDDDISYVNWRGRFQQLGLGKKMWLKNGLRTMIHRPLNMRNSSKRSQEMKLLLSLKTTLCVLEHITSTVQEALEN